MPEVTDLRRRPRERARAVVHALLVEVPPAIRADEAAWRRRALDLMTAALIDHADARQELCAQEVENVLYGQPGCGRAAAAIRALRDTDA